MYKMLIRGYILFINAGQNEAAMNVFTLAYVVVILNTVGCIGLSFVLKAYINSL